MSREEILLIFNGSPLTITKALEKFDGLWLWPLATKITICFSEFYDDIIADLFVIHI